MANQGLTLFFVVEVVFLGALFLVLPRIGRRGLLFGVYVGEERSGSEQAGHIRAAWNAWMGLSVVATLAFVGVAGWFAPAAVPLATLLLVGAFVGCYVRAHLAARSMAIPTEAPAVAALDDEPSRPPLLPLLTIAVGVAVGGLLVGYALTHYDAMPDRIPVHFNAAGEPDRWTDRSLASLLLLPVLTTVLGGFLGFFALLTRQAKRSLRDTQDPGSARAQGRFRLAVSRFLCGIALATTGLLAYLSVASIDVARGAERSIGRLSLFLTGGVVLFSLGGVIYLMARYGQGGARLEAASADAALTDGLADNRNWVLGVIYVNREDPSILVEKRFGLGYTINFGNPRAVAILAVFLAIVLGIVAAAIVMG